MYQKLVNRIMAELIDEIEQDKLAMIRDKICIIANDYDIKMRETAIIPYSDKIHEHYRMYCVTRKIEGLSQLTLNRYKTELEKFFDTVGKATEDVTTNDIRAYIYLRKEKDDISNRTLDGVRVILNSFFEWCANEGYIGKNPVRPIKPIKYNIAPREPLTALEMEKLRNACETKRDKAMIEFFYSTGCRVSEAVNADIKDINFDDSEVLLLGKGNKYRKSYINAKTEFALAEYFKERQETKFSAPIFVSLRKPHKRLTKRAIEKTIASLGEKAGIERRVFPHLIRHTTASDGINRGMDVTQVQRLLGHASVNTTMIYAHIDDIATKNNHLKCIV